ncbi:MAG TPA: ABC transporter ATP-binding protein [bacterium]|nr:ABC transporter ATP-binding protein [bacterium]
MTESIVSLQNVSRFFHQGQETIRAVNDVSLEIHRGDFAVVCGPSGSGKTTMLNMIGALDDPTEGTVSIDGRDLSDMSHSEKSSFRRDRLGFVFQAYNLIPVLTAYENAEFILTLQGMPKAERREKVMELLDRVGLKGLENRRPDEMSGGQQQRIAIVRAIVTEPAIVLADEPTANVDSQTAAQILDLMETLNREQGATFLFSSHDRKVIDRAKRVIRMRDGRIEDDQIVGTD